jgi:hypothetical protein
MNYILGKVLLNNLKKFMIILKIIELILIMIILIMKIFKRFIIKSFSH